MFKRSRRARANRQKRTASPGWAAAGMRLTFRAEVMPGRDATERTFTVARMLASGRVELVNLGGQHAEPEFESVLLRDK